MTDSATVTRSSVHNDDALLIRWWSPFDIICTFLSALSALTWSGLSFWREFVIFASNNHLKPSELRYVSIVLLGVHYLLLAALGSHVDGSAAGGVWELLLRSYENLPVPGERVHFPGEGRQIDDEEVSPLLLWLFGGVAVISTVALILSTHMWLNLLSRIALASNDSFSDPPGMAMAGILVLLVVQSIFPCVLVLNGAYACWTGDVLWLCGGVLTAIMWAMPTVGLFGAVRDRYLALDDGDS
mmetsp:Transcript_50258/g.151311  ORF Transcript_50258/g.151311 Transcript_50258/m.151311 type:complete len:242 (-) Transcript_50258:186-911(-)